MRIRLPFNAPNRILLGLAVAALCSELPQKAEADFSNKVTLAETSNRGPAMAYLGSVFIGWKGMGNNQLNLASSTDGHNFGSKYTSAEMSFDAPALCVHNNTLYIAWTGTNGLLNVAVINLQGSRVSGFSDKVTLSEMSTQSPALASVNGRLYIGWRGDGNDNLNVASSGDNGKTFGNKYTSNEASKDAPVLCSHNNGLFIAWKGVGNLQLNVASVNLSGPNVTGFNTVTLSETSPDRPALVSFDGKLFLAWRGNGSLNLSLSSSADNGRTFRSKFVSAESSLLPPALSPFGRVLLFGWTGVQNWQLNVAQAAESQLAGTAQP